MLVAASCCGEAFLQQRLGSGSELGRPMEPNIGYPRRKPVTDCKRLETGGKVRVPTGQ